MKLRTLVTFAAILMFTACGTTARYASSGHQRFDDGIYSNGPTFISKAERQAADKETEKLVEETKASEIYLFGDKKDTVMIPQNMSATIKFDQKIGTTVTIHDNPYDWRNNYSAWGWYTPIGFSAGWRFGWGYHNWHMSVHNPYYWHYGRYYDPWHYDPWYGYMGWYDPWFHDPWYHHYCGWYGGFGHIHHSWPHHPSHMYPGHVSPGHKPGHESGGHGGRDVRYTPRHATGSDHIYTSGSSSRNYGTTKESGANDRRLTSGRTTVNSTTGRNLRPVTGRQAESGTTSGTSSSVNRTTSTSSRSYRRPGTSTGTSSANRTSTVTTDNRSTDSRSGTYNRPGTSTGTSSHSYNRNSGGFSSSSSQSRSSSSSYSRSGSSSYSRSGSSSSGYTRSYSGGSSSGGGYSRSGGGRR